MIEVALGGQTTTLATPDQVQLLLKSMSILTVDLPLPALMKRDEFLDHAHLAPKLLALNNWLLDGRMKSGAAPAYQGTRSSLVCVSIMVSDMLSSLIDTMS